MGMLACIGRGRSIRRTSSYPRSPNRSLGADIAAGRTTPGTAFIEVPPTNVPGPPLQSMEDIPTLYRFWRHIFKRIKPPGYIAKAYHTSDPTTAGLQHPVQEIEEPWRPLQQETTHGASAHALSPEATSLLSSQHLAVPEPIMLCSTGKGTENASMGGTLLVVEGRRPREVAEDSTDGRKSASRATPGTVHGTERRPETAEASGSKTAEPQNPEQRRNERLFDASFGKQSRLDYNPSSTLSDPSAEAWIGASLLKLPSGESVSSKLFYDPGSTDNMITEALVARHGFRKHLIRPEDLQVFECVGQHFFTPRYYVEIELTDHEHGIVELRKASFNVADNLGGWALLVGRNFMFDNNLGMGPRTNPSTILVLTARPASEDAKQKQARLVEKNKHSQHLATQIMVGSSRSGTSSSSRRPSSSGQDAILSSRTSASSSTRVEGRTKL
ncbi:hypothetical protein BJ875DRAFT_100211 [Amylocarpus encephaloides]|uniref:Uncharacterized protein n=1 Tax=Amylocarpus encephaloides TaxID=45428 RepID=A0A9P7YDQ3_9HELO|nr:hypothetical protein BJ875DRAFT_100211 [Amylocarpus encephaloides]